MMDMYFSHNKRSTPPFFPLLKADFSSRLRPLTLPTSSLEALTPSLEPAHSLSFPNRLPGPITPYGTLRMNSVEPEGACDYFLKKAKMLLENASSYEPSAELKQLGKEAKIERPSFAVRFTWTYGAEHSVCVTGSFNGWGVPVTMHKMPPSGKRDSIWECVLRLSAGEYRYQYEVDGKRRVDTHRPCEYKDGVAVSNKLTIREADVVRTTMTQIASARKLHETTFHCNNKRS
ncbi:hypothetical protein BWQ96_07204 [Gracilariopsis chorda]|uniref:AMP-activated protein kinase glycogen-binding domain-containing protein n=1 Tax=Gracilariopsis chorda TaxID=448386 RepID=A0A2V3ILY4_9FLOR|nr:hypothetical protein BWQ96_07204 [Gracilariopsis chorda]|eukprot:PXF43057.1 hypothetical protein BWQ96_07204 [Gracilariopsis chorda]